MKIGIITNQQCIAKGIISKDQLEVIHNRVSDEFKFRGLPLPKFWVCPHFADTCNCRKPSSTLVLQALSDFGSPPAETVLMVGDSDSDVFAANNANIRVLHLQDNCLINDCPAIAHNYKQLGHLVKQTLISPRPFSIDGVDLVSVEGLPFFIPTLDRIHSSFNSLFRTSESKISNLDEIVSLKSTSAKSKSLNLLLSQIKSEGADTVNIIDVGAWVGFFGIIASTLALKHELVPNCNFYDPSSAGFLASANISINNLGRYARVNREALTRESSEVVFISEVGNSDNHRVDFGQEATSESIRYKVDSISFQDFLSRHPLGQNSIIKLDLEGQDTEFLWEPSVFQDCFLFFEFSPMQQLARKFSDYGKLDDLMNDFHLYDVGESYKGDKFERISCSANELVDLVLEKPSKYTDLLAIHKSRKLIFE